MADVKDQNYPYSLPELGYDHDALEPVIDTQTMQLHHGKHHQAYVDNLNKALESHTDLHSKTLGELLGSLDSVPDAIRGAVRNNGGGHVNHSMFWGIMSLEKGNEPTGDVADVITRDYGSLDDFKTQFNDAGAKQFGSGWVFVTVEGDALKIASAPNQDTPLHKGVEPLFGNDVWEHAYYLKYNNRRPDYLKAWWEVLDWEAVAERYAKLKG
ncbi:MAG: superoxide dismutase [Acidobacteria bacterium]|nr:superoxide dismutase [Acidobacteriota bacterium]